MDEELSHLIILQKIDTRLLRNKAELAGIPARLAETERVLDEARAREAQYNARLEGLRKKKKTRDGDLEDSLNRIKTLKSKVSEVKTNVEYQARLKEIDAAHASARKIEDEILVIMEEIEGMEPDRKAVEAAFLDANAEWEKTKRVVEESGKAIEAENADLIAERAEAVKLIGSELYGRYRHLMGTRHGLALARVENGICKGCHMTIPPQLFNEVRSSTKILSCSECGRMLYYQAEAGQVAASGA